MTAAVSLAQSVAPGVSLGFKNRIINGGMTIDQRNAGAASANTINGYFLDRWQVMQTTTGKLIAQQNQGSITPPAGFSNYLGVTSQSAYSVAAGDLFRISQQIEGFNFADMGWGTANAKPVALSFWVYSSLTGTFGGAIGNNGGTRTYPFTYSVPVANTWTQVAFSVPGDITGVYGGGNSSCIYLQFMLGGGSSTTGGTANTWGTSAVGGPTGCVSVVGTSGATFYITGVQLEVGTAATAFEFRDYGRELIMCQRYYEKSYAIGTVPGTATYNGDFEWSGGTDGGGNAIVVIRFEVAKRAAPTVSGWTWNGVAGSWQYANSNSSADTTCHFDQATETSVRQYCTAGPVWYVAFIRGHWAASAEL